MWGRRKGERHAKSWRGGKKEIEGIALDRLGAWSRQNLKNNTIRFFFKNRRLKRLLYSHQVQNRFPASKHSCLVIQLNFIFNFDFLILLFASDRMGKLFRENPIQVAFPEAVNLFSARAKFVREGSQKSTVRY